MAEDTLVKEGLTREMIEDGAEIVRRLGSRLPVSASLWLYDPELNRWRLVIASPEVGSKGPRDVYRRVQSVLREFPGPSAPSRGVSLGDVSVVLDDDPLVSLLRTAVKLGDGGSGVRFSRNTVDGRFIEDAYVYDAGSTP